jgi:hypothetical protein
MFVLWVFVLSGRGLCDRPIPRLGHSYRVWCVSACDLQTSTRSRPRPTRGCQAMNRKCTEKRPDKSVCMYIIICTLTHSTFYASTFTFASHVYTKFGRSWPHCKKGWTGLVYRLGGRIRPIFGGVILLQIFSMAWKKFESHNRLGCNVSSSTKCNASLPNLHLKVSNINKNGLNVIISPSNIFISWFYNIRCLKCWI